ncbi:MAG: hypothetical protein LBI77_01665 [Puniceicoccales bacterium]|jgi:hypothetical protein|nr:hypothetical protein [Puniceicoccales bacterium]
MELSIRYGISFLLWSCSIFSYGEIDDALIAKRIASDRHIVNFSVDAPGVQVYFKGRIYDAQRREEEFQVSEWKFRRDGKKQRYNQFVLGKSWFIDLISYMLKEGVGHDLYVGGKLAYRPVEKEEIKGDENFIGDDPAIPNLEDRESDLNGSIENENQNSEILQNVRERGIESTFLESDRENFGPPKFETKNDNAAAMVNSENTDSDSDESSEHTPHPKSEAIKSPSEEAQSHPSMWSKICNFFRKSPRF